MRAIVGTKGGVLVPDMSIIRKNIARNILYYRKKLNLNQKELAGRLSVGNSAISNWEKELNSPDIDTLFEMCRVFDININEMCGIEDNSSIEGDIAVKKSPEPESGSEDKKITLEESNALLVKLGYIKPGEDLSDADLAFLSHLIGLLDAWFSSK